MVNRTTQFHWNVALRTPIIMGEFVNGNNLHRKGEFQRGEGQMKVFWFIVPVVLLAGCGFMPPLNPAHNEERTVTPVTGQSRVLTLKEPEVWFDSIGRRMGIRFPQGAYAIEAEDDTFWYFRAPNRLEIRTFAGPNPGSELAYGGIALRKSFDALGVYAEGYTEENDATKKTLIWKLGNDFRRMEGDKWTKNF